MLSPAEDAEIVALAAAVREQDQRLDRLHQRIAEMYEAHRDDDEPVTMAYLAERSGYTEQRVQQIVAKYRTA